jgi:hypothetical protein
MLMNREMYQNEGVKKAKSVDFGSSSRQTEMSFEEMIRSLVRAGYEIRKRNQGTGG